MSNDPKVARSRARAIVFGAALGLLLVQASSAQAPGVAAAPRPPCVDAPVESPQACSGQPLDARAARLTMRGGPIALPAGAVGHEYPGQPLLFSENGAVGSVTADGALPRGISVDAAGVLRGVPLASGSFLFTLHAVDALGRSVVQTYVLSVAAAPAAPRPPEPRRAPPPPPPPPKPPEPAPEPVVERQPGIIDIYQLTAEDVKALHKLLDKPAETPPPVVVQTANQSATTQTSTTQTATAPAGPPQTSTVQTATTQTSTTQTSSTQTTTPPAASGTVKKPKPFVIKLPSISGVSAPQPVTRAVSDVNNLLKPLNGVVAFLAPKPKPGAAPAAAVAPAAPAPQDVNAPFSLADKAAMLQDASYPSRALFIRALAARYPPLTADVNDAFNTVVDRAHKTVSFDAAPPLAWTQEPGCRCNRQPNNPDDKAIYGFLPFWGSSASAKGPAIQFSQFDRIEFIGAQLRPDGLWIRPSNAKNNVSTTTWWARTSVLASSVQAHGAQLDLVLQAGDWGFLHGLDDDTAREQGAMAAQNAMTWVQTPLEGRGLRRLLFPFWHDPKHVFDGVTVMFSRPPPTASKGDNEAFDAFYDTFVLTLIEDMQRDGRSFALNLMAPETLGDATANDEDRLRADASFWHDFLKYKKLAEPASAHQDQIDKERSVFVGKSSISVRLLAPIREPTQDEKKLLRAVIDTITQVQGAGHVEEVRGSDRVEVLRSIIPILFLPSRDSAQLSDDMVFSKQNFGGFGLWPAPDSASQTDVYQVLNQVMASDSHKALVNGSFCNFPVRLIWQIMLLLTPLALIVFAIWGRPSGRPWIWMVACGAFPAVALVLSGFLLEFDPVWSGLKRGNLLLGVVVAAVIGGTILLLRPRPPRP